jgi:hypothetical protein
MKKIISILVMACMLTGCAGLKPDEMVKTGIQDNAVSTGTDISEGWENQEEGVSQQDENEKQSGSQQSFISRHWGKGVVCIIGVVAVACIINYYNKTYLQKEYTQGGQKGQVIKKTYNITATLDEKVRSNEEAMRIWGEIENLDEIKAGDQEVSINFNLELDSTPLRECLFKISYDATITALSLSTKELFCQVTELFCQLIRVGGGTSFQNQREASLGRIETSEPIDKLKVRCSKKFVEELIQIKSREVTIP